jgi:septation ring formation regulator EzrA
MRNWQKMDDAAAHPIPFPKKREMRAELRELDACFQSLREKIENGDEPFSIARSTALLYVDLLARVRTFARHLDIILGGRLFLAGRPLRENVVRANAALGIYSRLIRMMREATDRIFKCLGGQKVITIEALTRLAEQHPEARTVNAILVKEIQGIARSLAK